jgi:hypothetical protein
MIIVADRGVDAARGQIGIGNQGFGEFSRVGPFDQFEKLGKDHAFHRAPPRITVTRGIVAMQHVDFALI